MRSRQHQILILFLVGFCISPPDPIRGASHWAFQPITNPKLPRIENATESFTSIDHFVLSKIQARNLKFSPLADRTTLIRRATFDLIGLPPTPEEASDFLNDTSPDAYAKVIDRLLDSPHYGERWGRHWLDVARYADNKGYVFFEEKKFPWAYTYRDYVVNAFNKDLPFNQFVLEQLAADQLDLGEDKHALAAMGFLTLGGRFMNSLHDVLDDRIDVTTRGLLGLTVSCARCHDHKFDPIPTGDYYSLYGVFRSSVEPLLPPQFRNPPDTAATKEFEKEMKARTDRLEAFVTSVHSNIVSQAHARVADYLMAAHDHRNVPATEDFMIITDKGDLNPSVINRWKSYLANNKAHPVWIPWHQLAELPEETFTQRAPNILQELSNHNAPINPLVIETLSNSPPKSMSELAGQYAALFQSIDESASRAHASPTQSRDADNAKGSEQHPTLTPAQKELHQILNARDSPPNIPRQLGWGFLSLLPDRDTQGEFKKLIKQVEEWSMTAKAAPPRAMVLVDSKEPYHPRIFVRGNPNRPGQPVPRGFLSVLHKQQQKFKNGSGRLELAQAIIDPDNPLTARVIVNRIWLHHFGRGLVATPSDFGLRGDPPSHPKLLDHLATHFMKTGWSFKKMHRFIMLSKTYRQSNANRADALAVDPENRLLWKFNRSRLHFEATRDTLLAVSGSFDRTIGGPPVDILGKEFAARRTLYGFIDRMDLPGLHRTFDFPDPASTCPQRDQTTIAPQALYLMNHPFVEECARRLLKRPEIATQKDSDQRLNLIYQLLFSRYPTEQEHHVARGFFTKEKPDQENAWIRYIHALLMTNEFVFID